MLAKEFKEKGRVYKVQTFGTLHRQSAEEKLIARDQRAGNWVVANPRFFRS
jgi:hypothetical protein